MSKPSKRTKTLSRCVVLGVLSAALLVSYTARYQLNKTLGSQVNRQLNEHFSEETLSNELVKLNEYGVTKVSCFTHDDDGKPVLSCYLGSNQVSASRSWHIHPYCDPYYNPCYNQPRGSATSTFSSSANYYATVSSNGKITYDCQKLSDSQNILSVSANKSWLKVYMGGSILGDELLGDRVAVFVTDSDKTGFMPNSDVIPMLEKVFGTATKAIQDGSGLKNGISHCKLSVY